MTPIERISEKSQALSVLGLPSTATTADIRATYKKLAMERHPDHGNGSSHEFARITDAYRFLKDFAIELGIPEAARRVSSKMARPSVRPTETAFSDDVLAECKACIAAGSNGSSHVSTILHRIGRQLTYFVPTAPANGPNDVVVPTGELVDTRHAHPQVVSVNTRDISGGVYEVPRDICESLFPGARSVKIRFSA